MPGISIGGRASRKRRWLMGKIMAKHHTLSAALRHLLFLIGLVLTLVAVVPTNASRAGTASTTFQVTASVNTNCTITASPLAFGSYGPNTTNFTVPLDGQSLITLTSRTARLSPSDWTKASTAQAPRPGK